MQLLEWLMLQRIILYENHKISAVDMHVENLDSDKIICYPVIQGERINYQNK